MNHKLSLALLSALSLGAALPATASPVNVLWYEGGTGTDAAFSRSGGAGTGDYQAAVNALATANGWSVTFWNSGIMSASDLSNFNVLVVASNDGNWGLTPPVYTDLQNSLNATPSLFNPTQQRVELTGADADWHLTSTLDPFNPTDVTSVDTFLTNSVDWAGGGSGLGLVALGMDGLGGNNTPNFGFTGYSPTAVSSNCIGVLSSPINTGLTSPSSCNDPSSPTTLNGWGDSSHYDFTVQDSTTWSGADVNLNTGNLNTGAFTTLTSNPVSGTSGGSTVPEPSTLITLMGIGLAGFVAIRRRKMA